MTEVQLPDLSVLAGYVRNRIRIGGTAIFWLHGTEIFVTPTGDGRLLIAASKGASVVLSPEDRNNAYTYQKGGFRLQQAAALTRMVDAIRGKLERAKSASQDRKQHGTRTA